MEPYCLIYVNQTDSAILVYDCDPDQAEWIPKSQIEYDESEINCARAGDDIEINMPEWLAESKGFV